MKKQNFLIFHSENDGIQFKLVKMYTNRLCINEDDQCEVIEFVSLKDFKNHFVFRKILSSATAEVRQFLTILNTVREILNSKKKQHDEFHIHLLFGFPSTYFSRNLVKLHVALLDRNKNLTVTSLHGQNQKLPQTDGNHFNNKLTIGDDIESFIDNPKISDNFFPVATFSSSLFLKSDESFHSIICKRKSYSKRAIGLNFLMEYLLDLTLLIAYASLHELILKWFNEKISDIVNSGHEPHLDFITGYLLGFLLIVAIVFYTVGKIMLFCVYSATLFIYSFKSSHRINSMHKIIISVSAITVFLGTSIIAVTFFLLYIDFFITVIHRFISLKQ